jgi:hypothetical protein|tara:strand:+ start:87 stop:1343 length:1257 start_codon:yes stop_codon:yes gene_type:complete
MTITELIELQTLCNHVAETGRAENHEIDLDVLMMKDDNGEYIVSPVHCQRNHEEHSQDLAVQYEDRGGHVDGLGTNYHIAVPVKDFDVYSEDKLTFSYRALLGYLQNGNSRRDLLDSNVPDNYFPPENKVQLVIKPYSNFVDIKKDYDLIDNKNNAQQGKDEVYGAYRSHNIHKSVKGYIATGKIGRVLKFTVPNEKTAFGRVAQVKDELVCLSNLNNYDTAWSFLGKNNGNRPCALAAAILLLKDRNREDNIKEFIGRIINEGKEYHNNPLKYFEKVFERFDVLYNNMDSTFQKTNLDKFKMTPIERILWETFEIPRLAKQPGGEFMVPKLSYFGAGAQYQFSNPKRIISFYLYMILKGLDSNAAYLTEKGKKIAGTDTKEKMEIFGGHYESRGKKLSIQSPYDAIIDSIYGEGDDD